MFHRIANRTTRVVGSPFATLIAFLIIVMWAVSGPLFQFSDTWQLIINTGTTIVTFLMVFLIQSSQNENDIRLHEKLDELIHAIDKADDRKADS